MKHRFTRYGYSTYSAGKDGFYATGVFKRIHFYGKNTSHGERKKWKEFATVPLGKFPCRETAKQVGRDWVKQKQSQSQTVA